MARLKLPDPPEEPAVEEGGGMYFDEMPEASEFIQSGCTVLDKILGGGWALGRISNIYGENSAGKTLLGIEANANFARQFPDGRMYYRERESAWDDIYAETVGFPTDRVDKRGYEDGLDTIEDLFDDMMGRLADLKKTKEPALYAVDSLDAFPDDAETKQEDIRKVESVAKKARVLSQSFRLATGEIAKSRMHVMYVSQIRSKIGVTMGRKTDMTGGNAIRFYASQRLFLRQIGKIEHEIKGIKVPVGVWIKATNEKSKVGMPYRSCEFPILFSYGIDDLSACVSFLKTTGDLRLIGVDGKKKGDTENYIREMNKLADADYAEQMREVRRVTREVWDHIENIARERYLPTRRKYGG